MSFILCHVHIKNKTKTVLPLAIIMAIEEVLKIKGKQSYQDLEDNNIDIN